MQKQLTPISNKELLSLAQSDYWLHHFAFPLSSVERGTVVHCSWSSPDYSLTNAQVEKAREMYASRKAERLRSFRPGTLVLCAAGSPCDRGLDGAVGWVRAKGDFLNDGGERFFIELNRCYGTSRGFFVDSAINRRMEREHHEAERVVAQWNRAHPSFEHKPFPVQTYRILDRRSAFFPDMQFTHRNVLDLINGRFGCSYSELLVMPYVIGPSDYVSHPNHYSENPS